MDISSHYSTAHKTQDVASAGDFLKKSTVWVLTIIMTLVLLTAQVTLWVLKTTLRYSSKILFYSLLASVFVVAILILCSLYVVTFGTLHIP